MLLCEVTLQLFVLLPGLLLVLVECLSSFLKLAAKCLRRLVSTLHRLLQLVLEVCDFCFKLGDSGFTNLYVSFFHLYLLTQGCNLSFVVTYLTFFLSDDLV